MNYKKVQNLIFLNIILSILFLLTVINNLTVYAEIDGINDLGLEIANIKLMESEKEKEISIKLYNLYIDKYLSEISETFEYEECTGFLWTRCESKLIKKTDACSGFFIFKNCKIDENENKISNLIGDQKRKFLEIYNNKHSRDRQMIAEFLSVEENKIAFILESKDISLKNILQKNIKVISKNQAKSKVEYCSIENLENTKPFAKSIPFDCNNSYFISFEMNRVEFKKQIMETYKKDRDMSYYRNKRMVEDREFSLNELIKLSGKDFEFPRLYFEDIFFKVLDSNFKYTLKNYNGDRASQFGLTYLIMNDEPQMDYFEIGPFKEKPNYINKSFTFPIKTEDEKLKNQNNAYFTFNLSNLKLARSGHNIELEKVLKEREIILKND